MSSAAMTPLAASGVLIAVTILPSRHVNEAEPIWRLNGRASVGRLGTPMTVGHTAANPPSCDAQRGPRPAFATAHPADLAPKVGSSFELRSSDQAQDQPGVGADRRFSQRIRLDARVPARFQAAPLRLWPFGRFVTVIRSAGKLKRPAPGARRPAPGARRSACAVALSASVRPSADRRLPP